MSVLQTKMMQVVQVSLLLVCLAPLSGCVVAGAIASKVAPPRAVPAEHKLPLGKPVLLLVENYQRGPLQSSADELAQLIRDELIAHKAGLIISQDELLKLRTSNAAEFNQMKIQEIGQKLGAVEIIYVNLAELSVEQLPASEMLQGKIAVTVRVIDVATGKTKWPGIGPDREFKSDTDFVPKADVPTISAMQSQMLSDVAEPIGQLFYQYAAAEGK